MSVRPSVESPAGDSSATRSGQEAKAPLGLTVRVLIYLVAVHAIVGFFLWIFYLAGAA